MNLVKQHSNHARRTLPVLGVRDHSEGRRGVPKELRKIYIKKTSRYYNVLPIAPNQRAPPRQNLGRDRDRPERLGNVTFKGIVEET